MIHKALEKRIAPDCPLQPGLAMVTAAADEMQITRSVEAFAMAGHPAKLAHGHAGRL